MITVDQEICITDRQQYILHIIIYIYQTYFIKQQLGCSWKSSSGGLKSHLAAARLRCVSAL